MDKLDFDLMVARRYISKRYNAEKAGKEFSLTLSQFRKLFNRKYCAYTGREMHLIAEDSKTDPLYATIERIDSGKGYVEGNVTLVCQFINALKGHLENDEDEAYGNLKDIKGMVKYLTNHKTI